VEVAAIGGVEFVAVAFGGVGEEAELGAGEPAEAEGGGGEGGGREEEGEGFDGECGVEAAEVIEPEEGEGEGVMGVGRAGRGGEDGDGGGAAAEKRAGAVGGEGVLEIEIGREGGDAPGGELAAEEAAEEFAEMVALALLAEGEGGGFGVVIEDELAGFAAEFLDGEGEAAGALFGDGEGAAVELAGLVPGGDEEGAGFGGELKGAGEEGEGEFARFLKDRLAGGGEKGFDRGLDAGGMATLGPRGGAGHCSNYKMKADGNRGTMG
jgi:hypothetical protein